MYLLNHLKVMILPLNHLLRINTFSYVTNTAILSKKSKIFKYNLISSLFLNVLVVPNVICTFFMNQNPVKFHMLHFVISLNLLCVCACV